MLTSITLSLSVDAVETSYVTVENRSNQIAKIALPGSKPVRLQSESGKVKIELEVTHPNGVDAKAWWVSNPRQLCVIFVRYQGQVMISGKQKIRCLGH